MIKKLLTITLLVLMMSTLVGIFGSSIVSAASYYPYGCGLDFEVSHIEDDGSLSKVSCHSTFAKAKSEMKRLGEDYVVRNANSLSPSKIVAMNSGVAYAYPTRSGTNTMNLYSTPNFKNEPYKSTYVSIHYEMTYFDTERIVSNGGYGMIEVELNGFHGYCDLEYTDLVPTKYIQNNIPIWLGGNDKTSENEQPFKVACHQNYFIVNKNGNYYDLEFHYYQAYHNPNKAGYEPVGYTLKVGPALDFMKSGVKYYSSDAINFYSDSAMTKLIGKGYQYYQFLPLRTKTDISAETMDKFLLYKRGAQTNSVMKGSGKDFISSESKYGMNAALVYGLSCHESAYGTSAYAIYRYNLFGWNAFDSDPSKASYFSSVSQAIKEHMGINLRKFISIDDWRFFDSSLGNKGAGINVKYASDPYWGLKISSIVYELDKYSTGSNGTLTDYNKYDLALVDKYDAKVYREPSTKSAVLYTTGYGDNYQKDMVVVVLGEEGGFTKIQTTDPINSKGKLVTGTTGGLIEYDFDLSVGYMLTSDLTYLNCNKNFDVVAGEGNVAISSMSVEDGVLFISGTSYREGVPAEEYEGTVELKAVGTKNYAFNIEQTYGENDYIGFDAVLDLNEIECGHYSINASTEYKISAFDFDDNLRFELLPDISVVGDRLYSFVGGSDGVELVVENVPEDGFDILSTLRKLTIDNGHLDLAGVGVIKGFDFSKESGIEHEIILENYSGGDRLSFIASTTDSSGFNVNDGCDYKYGGFESSIDLKNIPSGEYLIKLVVRNGEIESETYIGSTKAAFTDISYGLDDYQYLINTNPLYGYRLELGVISSPLDYSKVNKPDSRLSLSSFDAITLGSDLNLVISGHSMMYYLDYSETDNIDYNVYLVKNNSDYLKLDTKLKACPVDYSSLLNSSYDMSNICFEASGNVKNLTGQYNIVVEIINGDYLDYVEIPNRSYRKTPGVTVKSKTYSVLTADTRHRLYLEAK